MPRPECWRVWRPRGNKQRSSLDVGLGPVVARRDLIVPPAALVLVGDAGGDTRHHLLAGGPLRRLAGEVVAGSFFAYPPSLAKPIILFIETFMLLSIATALPMLVAGPPTERPDQ